MGLQDTCRAQLAAALAAAGADRPPARRRHTQRKGGTHSLWRGGESVGRNASGGQQKEQKEKGSLRKHGRRPSQVGGEMRLCWIVGSVSRAQLRHTRGGRGRLRLEGWKLQPRHPRAQACRVAAFVHRTHQTMATPHRSYSLPTCRSNLRELEPPRISANEV